VNATLYSRVGSAYNQDLKIFDVFNELFHFVGGVAGSSKYVLDPSERKNNALAALKLLCDSPALEPYLLDLLSARDAQGQTPFMLGVTLRAYPAAATLLDTIQIVAGKQESEGNNGPHAP